MNAQLNVGCHQMWVPNNLGEKKTFLLEDKLITFACHLSTGGGSLN